MGQGDPAGTVRPVTASRARWPAPTRSR